MSEQVHSEEPRDGFVMGNLKTKQEMIEYVTKCINNGGDKFFFVSSSEDKDICHTGNGPKSFKNALRIANCVNACAKIEDPRQAVYQAWYQLKQVSKEFEKFGTLGDHRIEMVKQALALFPKEESKP